MALPMPVNAPAEFAEWVATLGEHFDENQRVLLLGMHSGSATATLRFLAAAATTHVRVHQQTSATYGAADHEEDIDCRPERQQDVTLDIADGQYVWLIPLWSDQGTLRAFDGATGPDHMAPIDLLGLNGAGSGLDADTLDGEHGLFYQDASNLISGVLADARVQESNVTQHQAALSIVEAQISDLNHFSGDAADLVGTLADARLSSNVALLNVANTFLQNIVLQPAVSAQMTLRGTSSSAAILMDAPAGNVRDVRFQSDGSFRWILRISSEAETGSNAGSNFTILSRNDAGNAIATVLNITRASGLVTLSNDLMVNGIVTSNGGFFTESTGSRIGPLAGNNLGRLRFDGNLKQIRFDKAGTLRWAINVLDDDNDGDNDGGDFHILARSDSGAGLSTPVQITRATGKILLPNELEVGGVLRATGNLIVTDTLTVNNDAFVLDVFNAQGRANIAGAGEILHFFQDAGGGATKQTVTGASNTDKINNLIAALDAYGLIVDGT